ncbi:M20/M25/M40 family metallo-hydrolase [Mucilaginibacter puniceus]
MKKYITALVFIAATLYSFGQDVDKLIKQDEVERIINTLAADDMQGRATFTPGIEKAAQFIEGEFQKIGLAPLPGNTDFRQQVTEVRSAPPKQPLFNVAGVIPGKSKPDEYVVFSAHYDHLGIRKYIEGDSIYNGADDDASGTTAVIALANYFKKINNNERTLIFVAFTAEEIGGFGAQFFSKQLNPDKVVAMFNIEMIGKQAKFGANSAFITGFERSDFGELLQKSLTGTKFKFYPDPYPEQRLFYRSDNATLARLGVPAHTISTVQIDTDKFYHQVTDEVSTLDMNNITSTIKAIALSSRSIVAGEATPTRVAKEM